MIATKGMFTSDELLRMSADPKSSTTKAHPNIRKAEDVQAEMNERMKNFPPGGLDMGHTPLATGDD